MGAPAATGRARLHAFQAAARAALEEKLNELDATPVAVAATAPLLVPAPPAPKANTWDVVAIPDASTTNRVETAPENKLPPPTVSLSATPPADAVVAAPAVIDAPAPPQTATTPVSQPAAAPAYVKPPNDIVTVFGTVYRNAQVEKVERDAVIISYWTANGGFAITKVDLNVLPADFLNKWRN